MYINHDDNINTLSVIYAPYHYIIPSLYIINIYIYIYIYLY